MQYFNYNGKLFENDTPVISAGSRGLRYGDGLFETIKCVNNQLIFADEHFARLWKGMGVLQFDIPKYFSPDVLLQQANALLKKNDHQKKARIRITIFRGNGGLYDAADHNPNYIIETWPLTEDTGGWNSNGLVLGIYEAAKKSCDILSNLKHNNYLPYVLAALHAKQQKWNDAIVLNSFERVCDTTIANIFYCKEESIYTPALSEGCVAGVVRKKIIIALKENGVNLVEKAITVEEILTAEEVFLTNSILDIRWVRSIADKQYTNLLTRKIAALFQTIS